MHPANYPPYDLDRDPTKVAPCGKTMWTKPAEMNQWNEFPARIDVNEAE
jgi:hypothetical protein